MHSICVSEAEKTKVGTFFLKHPVPLMAKLWFCRDHFITDLQFSCHYILSILCDILPALSGTWQGIMANQSVTTYCTFTKFHLICKVMIKVWINKGANVQKVCLYYFFFEIKQIVKFCIQERSALTRSPPIWPNCCQKIKFSNSFQFSKEVSVERVSYWLSDFHWWVFRI